MDPRPALRVGVATAGGPLELRPRQISGSHQYGLGFGRGFGLGFGLVAIGSPPGTTNSPRYAG